jgi:hypothetical protein
MQRFEKLLIAYADDPGKQVSSAIEIKNVSRTHVVFKVCYCFPHIGSSRVSKCTLTLLLYQGCAPRRTLRVPECVVTFLRTALFDCIVH